MLGTPIIRSSWITNAIFAVTAIPAAAGIDAFDPVAAITALLLFAVSLVVWVWAFSIAVVRSSNGDDIAVGSLFLFEGQVPKDVRRQLFASVGVCLVITAATASADPFGVLVPMLPVGLIGLWGAKHGVFRPRRDVEPEVRPLRPDRSRERRGHGLADPERPDPTTER